MVPCPSCSSKIALSAKVCPYCGATGAEFENRLLRIGSAWVKIKQEEYDVKREKKEDEEKAAKLKAERFLAGAEEAAKSIGAPFNKDMTDSELKSIIKRKLLKEEAESMGISFNKDMTDSELNSKIFKKMIMNIILFKDPAISFGWIVFIIICFVLALLF